MAKLLAIHNDVRAAQDVQFQTKPLTMSLGAALTPPFCPTRRVAGVARNSLKAAATLARKRYLQESAHIRGQIVLEPTFPEYTATANRTAAL